MPIYEYTCKECGKISEIIVIGSDVDLFCRFCNSENIEKAQVVLLTRARENGLASKGEYKNEEQGGRSLHENNYVY